MDEFERLTLNGELRFSIMASVTRCVQRGVSKKRTVYWRKHELIKNKYILRTYFKRTIRFQLLYYLPRYLPRVVVNMRKEIIKSMSNVIFHTLQRYRAIWEFLIIWSWYLIISTFSEESWLIIWIFCTPSFSSNYDKSHLHVDNIIVIASQLQSNCQFPVASTHTTHGTQANNLTVTFLHQNEARCLLA